MSAILPNVRAIRTAPLVLHSVVGMMGGVMLLWLFTHPQPYAQLAAGVLVLLVIGGVVLSDVVHRTFQASNIKYFVLASYAVFLGAGMLFDLGDGAYFFSGHAIALTLVSLFAFLLGFFWKHRYTARPAPRHPTFWLDPNQLFGVTLLFYAVGFGFLCAEWFMFGQLQSYSGRVASSRGIPVDPAPVIHVFTQLVGPACVLTLMFLRRGVRVFKRLLLLSLFSLTVIWYALWGARENFLFLAIACLIVWSELPDQRGQRRIGFVPAVVAVLSCAIMMTLSVVRTHWDLDRARSAGVSDIQDQLVSSLDIFRELRQTVEFFPRHMEFLNGYSFYGVVANVVPRAWWNDKPIGVGKLACILYYRNPNSTIALSLPGELYANFGTAGTVAGMFVFGVLVGLTYRWYSRQRGQAPALLVYIQLVWCALFEVRGDILDATVPVLYHVLPVVGVLLVATYVNRLAARQGYDRAGGSLTSAQTYEWT